MQLHAINDTEPMPTRWRAFVFALKAWCFRVRRAVRDMRRRPPRLPIAPVAGGGAVFAESRSALYPNALAAEFALQAGKVHNLRLATRALNGLEIPPGATFSFWRHVPRPTRGRGFVPGRELREGCVIPAIGGGLCQLSNALYDAALSAGFEIVERHAHSRRVAGSMAAAGRDATIFWNYVDLRFRAPSGCQLEVVLEERELVVRLRHAGGGSPVRRIEAAGHGSEPAPAGAGSCETCGITSCFRNPSATSLPRGATTAWLVDAWWPEFDAYVAEHRKRGDALLLPLDSRRWGFGPYRWNTGGFAQVRQSPWFVLRRSLRSRRLAAQGAARQRALLEMDAALAAIYARRIPYTALHVVVSQNLLPFLWREGALAGRTFDVLMTRLPFAELHRQLDRPAARWPEAGTLTDFRAPGALADDESAALAAARHWITPHRAIAASAGKRAVLLDWHRPAAAPRRPGGRVVFPASTLARKGAHELREVTRRLRLPLTLAGRGNDTTFWDGCDIRPAGPDWLADAAVIALPAWVEHEPRRLLTAIAAGVPVITTPASGLGEMPGVTLVPEGELDALARALTRFAEQSPQPPVESPPTPGGRWHRVTQGASHSLRQ